jgi:oligosaccharide repeat unit polymerase
VIDTAGAFAASRYGGELESTVIGKIGLLSAYLTIFTGGLFVGATKDRHKRAIALVAAFLPAILTATMQSAKGLLFLSMAFFFGGILINRIYDKNYKLITRKDTFVIFLVGILILPVITVSFLARGLTQTGDIDYILTRIYGYLVSYSSGHMYAFSDWFSSYIGSQSLMTYQNIQTTPGFFSAISLYRLLGNTTELPPGTYSEYYRYGEHLQSNIYTAFRGTINDFGIFGSLITAFLLGSLSNITFQCVLRSNRPPIAISLFFLMMGMIYMSYLVSIFTWSVIPAAIISCMAMLTFNFSKIRLR